MNYLVFAQPPEPVVPLLTVIQQARRFFEASVNVLSDAPVRLELSSAQHGYTSRFTVLARPRAADDLDRARRAEIADRAAGMAALAERCPMVWEIVAEGAPLIATLTLSALLASVALGPVLPPDDSTLFGVRGAMQRVEQLAGG